QGTLSKNHTGAYEPCRRLPRNIRQVSRPNRAMLPTRRGHPSHTTIQHAPCCTSSVRLAIKLSSGGCMHLLMGSTGTTIPRWQHSSLLLRGAGTSREQAAPLADALSAKATLSNWAREQVPYRRSASRKMPLAMLSSHLSCMKYCVHRVSHSMPPPVSTSRNASI